NADQTLIDRIETNAAALIARMASLDAEALGFPLGKEAFDIENKVVLVPLETLFKIEWDPVTKMIRYKPKCPDAAVALKKLMAESRRYGKSGDQRPYKFAFVTTVPGMVHQRMRDMLHELSITDDMIDLLVNAEDIIAEGNIAPDEYRSQRDTVQGKEIKRITELVMKIVWDNLKVEKSSVAILADKDTEAIWREGLAGSLLITLQGDQIGTTAFADGLNIAVVELSEIRNWVGEDYENVNSMKDLKNPTLIRLVETLTERYKGVPGFEVDTEDKIIKMLKGESEDVRVISVVEPPLLTEDDVSNLLDQSGTLEDEFLEFSA
ncbi:MAG: hypothetical protein P9M03_10750, partial [Candidatus Theseobacter exili]|nr:hypothetical protein [Candidatus Theseobacter exili]